MTPPLAVVSVDRRTAERLAGRRRELRQVTLVWAALFLNVLTFAGPTVLPIPGFVGQMVTQAALLGALAMALAVNTRGLVRVNLFLVLLTMLAVVPLMVSIHSEFLSGVHLPCLPPPGLHRGPLVAHPVVGKVRLALLRAISRALRVVLGTVLVGAAVAPGARVRLRRAPVGRPVADPAHSGGPLRSRAARRAPSCCGSAAPWSAVGRPCSTLVAAGTALVAPTPGPRSWPDHRSGRGRREPVPGPRASPADVRARCRDRRRRGHPVLPSALSPGSCGASRWRRRPSSPDAPRCGPRFWARSDRPLEELFGSGLSNKSFNGLPSTATGSRSTWTRAGSASIIDATLLLILFLLAATHRRGAQARSRAVPGHLLPDRLVHRDRAGDASPYLLELIGGVASWPRRPREGRSMKILIVHNRYRPDGAERRERRRRPGVGRSGVLGPRGRPSPTAQRGDRHLVAAAPRHPAGSSPVERGIATGDHRVRWRVPAGCRSRPQHFPLGDAVGPVRLPRCRRSRSWRRSTTTS